MGRKHSGKKRNCSLQAISPFPTVFSKDLYCRHVKTRLIDWERVKTLLDNKILALSKLKAFADNSSVTQNTKYVFHSIEIENTLRK